MGKNALKFTIVGDVDSASRMCRRHIILSEIARVVGGANPYRFRRGDSRIARKIIKFYPR